MSDEGSAFESKSASVDRDRLLQNAIGDSVVQPLLFRTEYYPRLDRKQETKGEKLPKPVQRVLRTLRGYDVLNRPVVDFLEPNEQPHFVFYSTEPIEATVDGESTTYEPERHLSLAVVTDERILFLVGQEDDDQYAFCPYPEIESVFYNDSVDEPYLAVHAGERYTIRDCHPVNELTVATEYVDERAVSVEQRVSGGTTGEDSTGDDWRSTASAYASESARAFSEQVDAKHVLKCGTKGATLGWKAKVGGPKGVAVAFVIGASYGIYDCLSKTDETVEAPDPETVAEAATDWRREASNADERTVWIATALGVATEFAAHNDDSQIAALLADVDPATGVAALEQGATMIDSSDVDLVPAGNDLLDSLSAVDLPSSATEFAHVTRELFDAGLLDQLHDVSKGVSR